MNRQEDELERQLVSGAERDSLTSPIPPVARFCKWLPEPAPCAHLLGRAHSIRWEIGAVAVLIAGSWCLVSYWLISFNPLGNLGPFLVVPSFWLWRLVRTRRAWPELAQLADRPSLLPQFPVEVRYEVYKNAYGADKGMVSFVDGWLHFEGRLTSWSVQTNGVTYGRPETVQGLGHLFSCEDRGRHLLHWRSKGRILCVSVVVQDQLDGSSKGLQAKFVDALQAWQFMPCEDRVIQVWPPTSVMPTLVRALETQFELWSALKLLSIATALVGLGIVLGHHLIGVAVVLLGLIGMTAGESARGKVADRLETIAKYCDGGSEEVKFRRNAGPLWKRLGKPFVT